MAKVDITNTLLSARAYGEYRVCVVGLKHGVHIINGGIDQTRNGRTIYFQKVSTGSFILFLSFNSHEFYQDFCRWLQDYGRLASTPNTPVGTMRAIIPSMGFDKVGVPTTGISFGNQVGNLTFPMVLDFSGAREALDFSSPSISKFVGPAEDTTQGQFFYPAGTQLTAGQTVEDALYGDAPKITLGTINIGIGATGSGTIGGGGGGGTLLPDL